MPTEGETGNPVFTDADLWSECLVEETLDTGDAPPLTLFRLIRSLGEADRAKMERRLVRNIAVDALAIREWREERRDPDLKAR